MIRNGSPRTLARSASLLAVTCTVLAASAGAPALARWQPQSTLSARPSPIELTFAAAEGWRAPEVGQLGSAHTILIRFASAPDDAPRRVGDALFDRERHAFDYVQVTDSDKGPVLLLRARRPLKEAGVDYDKKADAWKVTLQLDALPPLPGASYADMVPQGSAARHALEEVDATWDNPELNCETLVPHAKRSEPWGAWIRLRLADCWRKTGRRNDAILSLRSLATSVHTPSPIVALAALRLEEWPESWNPHQRLPWPKRRDVLNLPAPIVEELSLRAARHLLYQGRGDDALAFLERSVTQGTFSSELRNEADLLRLELMYYFTEFNDLVDVLGVYELAEPPAFGSPAAAGMERLAGLAYARLNQMALAEQAARHLIDSGLGWVDPELLLAFHGLYRRNDQVEAADELFDRLPAEFGWVEALVERGLVSAPVGEELASWLEVAQSRFGVRAMSALVGPMNVFDGARALSEGRLAVLLAALDCKNLGNSPAAIATDDWPLFAAICYAGQSDAMGAGDVWGRARRDPMTRSGMLSDAAERYSTTTVHFFERFGGP